VEQRLETDSRLAILARGEICRHLAQRIARSVSDARILDVRLIPKTIPDPAAEEARHRQSSLDVRASFCSNLGVSAMGPAQTFTDRGNGHERGMSRLPLGTRDHCADVLEDKHEHCVAAERTRDAVLAVS
jgi:hypothetical protein